MTFWSERDCQRDCWGVEEMKHQASGFNFSFTKAGWKFSVDRTTSRNDQVQIGFSAENLFFGMQILDLELFAFQ